MGVELVSVLKFTQHTRRCYSIDKDRFKEVIIMARLQMGPAKYGRKFTALNYTLYYNYPKRPRSSQIRAELSYYIM